MCLKSSTLSPEWEQNNVFLGERGQSSQKAANVAGARNK